MYSRLLKIPKNKSFFLFGPRATGKTTWVKSIFPKALYVDLLEAELFNDFLVSPQRLDNLIPKDFNDWIIIDEIQKIPELLNEVHRLIELRKLKFILTGSSARKLKRKGPNLLAGRALTYFIHPLTISELGSDYKFEHSLRYGQLPSVYREKDPKKYLESYVKTYLEEEIQQEGLTRNLASFSRFLETASFSQGSVLNVSEIAREAAVERKVVENYFSIIEDLLIGSKIYPFTKRAKRRMIAHPKFYFFDVGVYRTLRPMGPLDVPEEVEGAALETLLFQELKAINDYLELGYRIYYYRTAEKAEVDFILYGEKGIKAFEIKRTKKIKTSMLKGLKTFLKDYPEAKTFFLYWGERRMKEGEIEIIPLKEALSNLKSLLD
ncbi:ATPase [Candidatus Roizmanbacteria bacterium CG_4_9_14_3_um_filter_33_18]|uniref:ATPase n=3 Tax=Candidatus Roizmaniibacteriota TaxID=1752723 RepID=A0A2M7U9P9_9BACT|nr:MAG: ATPase [Candidatus Roizmanbacteria bacterium CG22_combo_CG10-13_8_21_14_all_34_12]PIZ67950.1 MAG: ATPase [Candidatus Roizmanbacteria bacterium CG_4_10_14_0_2_um_filter_33_96]PJA55272.1 MAG: ATPase [Candidatus Roizmanbacteria bacterium CG_4_9_14_3_um_filter_33_18]